MNDLKIFFKYKPQINLSWSSNGRMWLISGVAFLCVLQSAIGDNGRSLALVLTALFFALLIEFLLTWQRHGTAKVRDGSSVATALLMTMLLPNELAPVFAALGAAFAIVVVKYSFGGLGSNWLNPAIGGWLFIRFSWFSAYSDALEGSSASISELIVSPEVNVIGASVTDFFNNSVFSLFGLQIPAGYLDLLFYNGPGLIVDRGLFALLIGTVFITAIGINRGWVPLAFLAVYGFLIRFAGDLFAGGSGLFWNGDMLHGILSGGTIAAAFIFAAEPSSSAKLKQGILFSVILMAVFSWFFRYWCLEYLGAFVAIAVVNCLTPLIRLVEEKVFLSGAKQKLNKQINNRRFKENLS